jgi:membrane protein DedA with SNARE-associated domain
MSHHLEIVRALAFIERHGYALLFFWVLAEQSAIPLPSAPLLVAAGALIHAGRLRPWPAILCCILAAFIADNVWFSLGRYRGRQILRLICRVSLEQDSCVRQTENAFLKYGLRSLLVSKFVPGLNAVAAPMAGSSRSSYFDFAFYDTAGALLWSGAYLATGFVFSEQLEDVVGYASSLGLNLLLLIAVLFAAWIGWKWRQRRRFLKQLVVARITPAELNQRLTAGEEVFIMDLRGGFADAPATIPGAVRISPEHLAARIREIPRDREVVLLCS